MLKEYLRIHRPFGILLDTNILLLYLIGSFNTDYIREFNRTAMYDAEDFEWVIRYSSFFEKVVITPHILTEVWHFVKKVRNDYLSYFIESSVNAFEVFKEDYVDKKLILQDKSLQYVGVTDLSIIIASKTENYLVLTDDLRAYATFLANDVHAINVNQLKSESWLST